MSITKILGQTASNIAQERAGGVFTAGSVNHVIELALVLKGHPSLESSTTLPSMASRVV